MVHCVHIHDQQHSQWSLMIKLSCLFKHFIRNFHKLTPQGKSIANSMEMMDNLADAS